MRTITLRQSYLRNGRALTKPVGTVRPQAVTVRMRIKQNVPYSDKSETRAYPCVRLRCANRTYAAMPHAGGNAAMRALCGGGC